MEMPSLIDSAQDAVMTGLSAQVSKKAKRGNHEVGGRVLSDTEEKQLHKTAQDFEAFFVGQMMEQMMTGIEPDPNFGGGHGEEMWRSMLNQEYGKELAKSNKLGIADHVMRGMLAAQEQRDAGTVQKQKTTSHTTLSPEAGVREMSAAAIVAGAVRPIRK